ncbi:acetyl-CoA carboxylase biotin carboxylase subunit [Camelimonas lactis]|uniref:3-methylcrotonyl-CoA carboxylase alpha subunit n=1 Tax=Camelimonas lactis TaxID=659006 RepID=A0A4R2GU21_9HYPH|nr:acetyl/propionyl/methylcrotonyl-CoA carboxylase subunit alpha [Camelimonas lactis]TCO13796.1 3-methylcrotonyl-CoA carboxylase alpha subunit [Camelimonas lactis]
MFDSVLIANRGEIACRVARSARALGMRVIAVHSEADRDAPFVRQADEAICIGPAAAAESYLRIDRIIAAAQRSGARCIHPGYGFLSERPDFADACAAAGVVLVGPPAAAMRAMGLKDAAKALAQKAGVPVVPGYHGDNQDPAFLKQQADAIGYPVLIKAVSGGGGKGMRRVDAAEDFLAALESAQREGASSFGDPRVLVEKYVLSPRHIEIQIFADSHGNVVHLFERDCSLQRRHQKVIEEAPAPGMTDAMRAAMGKAAVDAARAVGYVGAGTVEFIADGRDGLRPDRFWFMEMNTRLQVEHPVTEAITGLDLVRLQFEVAAGGRLPFVQDDLRIDGHAVEARLYAEDPERGFLPSTGHIWLLDLPQGEGVRVDSGVAAGGEVSSWYDPMIAKIIAHGPTRAVALDRLARALGETRVAGPRANAAFLKRLVEAADFRAGAFDTGFIDAHMEELGVLPAGSPPPAPDAAAVAAGVLALQLRAGAAPAGAAGWPDPWSSLQQGRPAFQLLGARTVRRQITADGEKVVADVRWDGTGLAVTVDGAGVRAADAKVTDGVVSFADGAVAVRAGGSQLVVSHGRQVTVAPFDPFTVDLDHVGDAGGVVKSPMHGKIIAVLVEPGAEVTKGQRLAVVEAMKMEHPLTAPKAGVIAEVRASVGQQVAEGATVIMLAE